MSTKFNAKRFPVQDAAGDRYACFVEDLCRIEEAGSTLRLLFAQVHSSHYGGADWRQYRQIMIELIIPAEARLLIAQELLNFKGVPTTEAQADFDGEHETVLLH